MFRSCALGAFLVALSSASPLLAQGNTRGGTADQQNACRNDVVKLCRSVQGGSDMDIYQCLQSNGQKLSKKCREALSAGR